VEGDAFFLNVIPELLVIDDLDEESMNTYRVTPNYFVGPLGAPERHRSFKNDEE